MNLKISSYESNDIVFNTAYSKISLLNMQYFLCKYLTKYLTLQSSYLRAHISFGLNALKTYHPCIIDTLIYEQRFQRRLARSMHV